ncbi:MAG TPA: CPBP family glutamic-type intramembrane protease, partial [Pseudonocardia sp.]|nr:CPBP family glutamic-type intramembrane protease [Pseudonocardia sp.]
MTGAEESGTGEHEGRGPEVETGPPPQATPADTPFVPEAWQPHPPSADLRSAASPTATAAPSAVPPLDGAFAGVGAAPRVEPSATTVPLDGALAGVGAAPAEPSAGTVPLDGALAGVGAAPVEPSATAATPPDGLPRAVPPAPVPDAASMTPWGMPGAATPPAPAPGWGPPPRHGPFGPPHPPRAPHRWGLGAYFIVEAVFLLTSALLAYALAGSLTSSAWAIALALSVPTICAAGLAALITRIRGNGPRIDLGLTMNRRDVVVGVACGLAGLAITIPASVLYVAIVGADATSAVGEALGGIRATPALAVLIFVLVVFVAPFCEEVVYRGLLWGAVERLGANRWWALAITTFVFALAHFEFSRTPLLLVVAIPIGIARVITGRLPAGVIAHQINNLLP